eukprot:gnl/TRDRNA2_/TRDRNA2_169925_c4_seq1.p1 gnl/TRDRNA2_/TRDRNA2_169925_c4~~gnl/TRDRNA2_/TRDRNA2_169925_c4_seq1.p1  ORF type:complete len:143 (+),score=22.56 gnl/TRDRNA2_/TRDRNA2_169925_c4_seq1:38-430(+)
MLRLIHAIVAGCRAEPTVNAWFDGDQLSMRKVEKIDLGIAVDTPDGLFVPVLRDVANRDDGDLREGLDRLRRDVEQRRIPPKELQRATLSLSNKEKKKKKTYLTTQKKRRKEKTRNSRKKKATKTETTES